jgi:hypothetical protein
MSESTRVTPGRSVFRRWTQEARGAQLAWGIARAAASSSFSPACCSAERRANRRAEAERLRFHRLVFLGACSL